MIVRRRQSQVVAEGVETAEQLERIRALDCDQWQGYYCRPPQPAADLAERVAEDAAISSTGFRAALRRGLPPPRPLTV